MLVPVIGTSHKPVRMHLFPCNTNSPLYQTFHSLALMVTVHPARHNCTSDTKKWPFIPGIMCPFLASIGSFGMSSSHVWLDWSVFPSGILTFSGFWAICLLITRALVVKKCPVAPESAKPKYCAMIWVRIRGSEEFNLT
jgi:uncharacterized membrane protein YgdD (TMEM256/DUF423 family)